MKPILPLLILLTASVCLAQEPGTPEEPKQTVVIAIQHGECVNRHTFADVTAEEAYDHLDRIVEQGELKDGDTITLEQGDFKGGRLDQLLFRKFTKITLRGVPGQHRLIGTSRIDPVGPKENPDKPAGPFLQPPDNGEMLIEDLCIDHTPENPGEDGGAIGFAGSVVANTKLTLRRVIGKWHDWGIYDWSLRSIIHLIIEDCQIVAARMPIALCHSASNYTVELRNSDIGVDGNLSRSYGASSASDPVTGGVYSPIVLRAGTLTAEGCTFWAVGWSSQDGKPYSANGKFGPVRMACVATDKYYTSSSRALVMNFKGCRVTKCEPGIATIVTDLDIRYGTYTWDNSESEAEAEASITATEAEWEAKRAEAAKVLEGVILAQQAAIKEANKLLAAARGGSGPDGELRVWVPEAAPVVETTESEVK